MSDTKFQAALELERDVHVGGTLSVGDLTYPTEDGQEGYVLTTDGEGGLTFEAPTGGGGSVPTGTTLNSTLRWNGSTWVENTLVLSTSDGTLDAEALIVAGQVFPTEDGTAGQVLTTDGALTLSWTSLPAPPAVPDPSDANPATVAAASAPGTSEDFSRADHVHGHGNQLGGSTHALANETTHGFLSAADFNRLAALDEDLIPEAGTLANDTLRWDGTAWVPNANVTATAEGDLTVASLEAAGLSYPTLDGGPGQVLVTDGFGNLTFDTLEDVPSPSDANPQALGTAAPGTSEDFSRADHVHQLPAGIPDSGTAADDTLRWNGTIWVPNSNIKATAAGGLTVATLEAAGLAYPTTDGADGDVLTTDGLGNLTFAAPAGGGGGGPGLHYVRMNGHNGAGSTNNLIVRFSTTVTNVGTSIELVSSASNGDSFLIHDDGVYAVTWSLFTGNAGGNRLQIAVGSSLSNTFESAGSATHRQAATRPAGNNYDATVNLVGFFSEGDRIWMMSSSTAQIADIIESRVYVARLL